MRRLFTIILLLWSLLLAHQTAWADDPNTIVFRETFDQTGGTGGRDNVFTGNIASSTIKYDMDGWTATSCGGASQCVKFGTGSASGAVTTPEIPLGGASYALLTFSAAGWGDSKANTLTVTPTSGYTLTGDNNIAELENALWNEYSVLIKVTDQSATLQLTFTGKRGFLDDVVVRAITTVPDPTLQDEFTFFPNTTEANASKSVTLAPVNYTTAFYTTDGSTPSKTNGTEVVQTTGIAIQGTTTVKAIAYVGDLQSQVVTKTYTQGNTVSGIAAFNGLSNDTEARLFIAANDQARVLHGTDGKLYLRDNTGTLCMDFGTTATFNPEPQHNQHVAGWIVGKKETVNGLPKLVATANTTTDFLALAAPVTETATTPVVVSDIANVNNHIGDWVKAENVRNDQSSVTLTNVYSQALVDVAGIVTANGTITPVEIDNIKSVVYVIDEDEAFVSPDADIDNATVRLKRTLSKDYWNTFVVPFDIAAMEGSIREYDQADGNVMKFKNAADIEAGKPYLVKPTADIVNPTYENTTLKATAAQTVTNGDYSFVATYSPRELATDQTELFLKTDGMLYYSNNGSSKLKGMRAYFQVPAGQNARIMVVDDADMATVISRFDNGKVGIENVYNLNGQRVKQPGRGIYIVNGKKVFIQ